MEPIKNPESYRNNGSSDCEQSGDSDDSAWDDDIFVDDFDIPSTSSIHPVLVRDIELLKERCSQDSVSYRTFHDLDQIDIDILLSTSHLERSVSEPWGLIHGEPICIRLSLNARLYIQAESFNTVEVFQKSIQKSGVSILKHLKYIIAEFCRRQFRELDNTTVEKAVESCHTTGSVENPTDKDISELLDMGFFLPDVLEAFRVSDGSKILALDYLLQLQESCFPKAQPPVSPRDEISQPCQDPKEAPSLKSGFLVQLYNYIHQRLLSLNDYCPVCDKLHVFSAFPMLQPVVCDNPLCIFSFQTLGVMADVAESITSQPQVVDLLITLTKAAALSTRHDIILSPYPTIINPYCHMEMALDSQKKDHCLLKQLLTALPDVPDMMVDGVADIYGMLHKRHVLCYPLLRWIITSNRSHIVVLPKEKQLDFMQTPHQFLLRNSPPVEDQKFRIHKRKFGSTFAFHGSALENWHSIIREGLLVASGTKRQMNGAAYGKGIYLSPLLRNSLTYSNSQVKPMVSTMQTQQRMKKNGKDFMASNFLQAGPKELGCIALCEVINGPNLKHHGPSVWTCSESEYVCTRFFFVFDKWNQNETKRLNIDVNTEPFIQHVKDALGDEVRQG